MGYGVRSQFDSIRELAYSALSDSYVNVGGALTKLPRVIKITNATNATVYFSDGQDDDDPSADKLKLPANSYQIWDITANKARHDLPQFFAVGTQFQCRYITGSAPTTGWVSIEALTVVAGR